MINLKKRNPFGAAATLLYRKRNISRYVVSAGASTIFPAPFLFYFLSRSVEKFRVDGTTFFLPSVQVSVRLRAILFSQWSLYNRMKRIGGSRSYRRLSIEALKKKRGGPSVVCMQRRMGRSSTQKRYLFIESLFSEARWRSGPTILSTFVQSTDAYTQRKKKL